MLKDVINAYIDRQSSIHTRQGIGKLENLGKASMGCVKSLSHCARPFSDAAVVSVQSDDGMLNAIFSRKLFIDNEQHLSLDRCPRNEHLMCLYCLTQWEQLHHNRVKLSIPNLFYNGVEFCDFRFALELNIEHEESNARWLQALGEDVLNTSKHLQTRVHEVSNVSYMSFVHQKLTLLPSVAISDMTYITDSWSVLAYTQAGF